LIHAKIIKIVVIRCHTLKLKCTKFDFGWGSAGGAYSAPPDPLARFKGPILLTEKGRTGEKGKGGKRRGEIIAKGRGGAGKKKKTSESSQFKICRYTTGHLLT